MHLPDGTFPHPSLLSPIFPISCQRMTNNLALICLHTRVVPQLSFVHMSSFAHFSAHRGRVRRWHFKRISEVCLAAHGEAVEATGEGKEGVM